MITGVNPAASLTAHRWLTVVFVGLVLLQAVLAGRYLYDGADIAAHGHVGNATFAVSVLAAVAAWRAGLDRRHLGLAVAVVLLTFSQTGLGYTARNSTEAAAWHLPLGVLTFGVGAAQAALAWVVTPARA